jgi:hypothetical protein
MAFIMNRFMGMMLCGGGERRTFWSWWTRPVKIQALRKWLTIIYADSSSEYKDEVKLDENQC